MSTATIDSFVTYEQAQSLKALGYNEKGYFFYSRTFCDDETPVIVHKGFVIPSTNEEMDDIGMENHISAPTHSQAAKWLRGKKMSVEVEYNVGKNGWYCSVRDMNEGYNLYYKFGHKTYEGAFSDAISNAIRILMRNGAEADMA